MRIVARLFFVSLMLPSIPVSAACLSAEEVWQELGAMARLQSGGRVNIIPDTPADVILGTMPPAAWDVMNRWPAFRECGLSLQPNDLRYVYRMDELAATILWGLRQTGRSDVTP